MMGLNLGRLGIVSRALAAWTPAQLWPLGASSPGMWIDPPYTASMFQDSTGTTPISAIGTVLDTSNPVGLVLDRKGGATVLADPGIHLSQATSTSRSVASARKNELVGTAALATQNVTTTAIPYTISFGGAGTVTASGTHVGALTNGQTFTPTAGTLTLTIAGSVTTAQLERGSAVTSYQRVNTASDYDASAGPTYLKFDGVDDSMATAAFAAGTLTSGMDCMIAVRRDSAAETIVGPYKTTGGPAWVGRANLGDNTDCVSNVGNPTVLVDGTALAARTVNNLALALTVGGWHIFELRNLDLSAWTTLSIGDFTAGYQLNGALGDIMLYPSTASTTDKDAARQWLADYYGVTLA